MYAAYTKRKMAEELTLRKMSLVAALYSNPNYDEKEADRPGAIRQIDDMFKEAYASIYPSKIRTGGVHQDPLKTDPFFTAMNVPHAEVQ